MAGGGWKLVMRLNLVGSARGLGGKLSVLIGLRWQACGGVSQIGRDHGLLELMALTLMYFVVSSNIYLIFIYVILLRLNSFLF